MNHLTLTAADVLALTPKSKAQLAIEIIMADIVKKARDGNLRCGFGTFDIDDMWKPDSRGDYVLTPMGDTVIAHLRHQGFEIVIHQGIYPVIDIKWAKS